MPSLSRRQVLALCGTTIGLGIAGCTGNVLSKVSNKEAKKRALTAEKKHLTQHLQNATCLTDWGTDSTTANQQATITNRTADSVYVEVTHPYWYSTENLDADGGSNAVYVVGPDSIQRVRGDQLSPC